ncbi:MAG: hypothetical protein Kow0090_03810 [Myxococcota bacterium]
MPKSPSSDDFRVEWKEGECLVFLAGALVAQWNAYKSSARLFLPASEQGQLSKFLSFLFTRSQLEFNGGGTLHASAVNLGGGALVFCGKSGAGKTTLWRFARPNERLDDELCNIIRQRDGGFSTLAKDESQIPIRAIFFPMRGKRFKVKKVSPPVASANAFSEIYRGLWFNMNIEKQLSFSIELAKRVPSYQLYFPKDPTIINRLREELEI